MTTSVQRYEGASTLYGPNTLAAYINRTAETLHFLAATKRSPRNSRPIGLRPPDNSDRSMSFISGVVYDRTGAMASFGEVVQDVTSRRFRSGETVNATFVGANPRNNLRLEGTFAAVERKAVGSDQWTTVRDDSDWGLIFRWRRRSAIWGTSEAIIEWEIEDWTEPGQYRLRYYGDAKSMGGKITAFEGTSKVFTVMG